MFHVVGVVGGALGGVEDGKARVVRAFDALGGVRRLDVVVGRLRGARDGVWLISSRLEALPESCAAPLVGMLVICGVCYNSQLVRNRNHIERMSREC